MTMTSADSAEVLAADLLEDSVDSLEEEAHPEAEELEEAFNQIYEILSIILRVFFLRKLSKIFLTFCLVLYAFML
ncbi:hypothetical protein DN0046_05910 [Finegoldia magna]